VPLGGMEELLDIQIKAKAFDKDEQVKKSTCNLTYMLIELEEKSKVHVKK
jgi:hypothetical protein